MSHRVLVVGEYGTLNGGENSFLAVAPALIKRGWEFCAAVPFDSDFANVLRSTGIEIHDLSMQNPAGHRKTQSELRSDIAQLIGLVEPELIHCNSLSTSRICAPVASELGLPSLGYLRDILKLSNRAVSDINQLDRIIAVSLATLQWHCDQGIDRDKTSVVYNGVNTDLFFPSGTFGQIETPCPIRLELGIGADAPVLLFVGQIGIRKGVDTLVDAFLTVAESVPHVQLLIAGQRHSQKQEAIEYEVQLRTRTESSIHRHRIHWLGSRTDIAKLMRAATILVHPARQEPLGRVLLEAAASGLPIVTTRVGGSPEILQSPELEGLLVSPNDPIELSARILSLIGDARRMEGLGTQLRELAKRTFSIENCARQLDAHYSRLLDQ
jgi:glycosyltransferase involved in cell wall biosynthesis